MFSPSTRRERATIGPCLIVENKAIRTLCAQGLPREAVSTGFITDGDGVGFRKIHLRVADTVATCAGVGTSTGSVDDVGQTAVKPDPPRALRITTARTMLCMNLAICDHVSPATL